MYTYCFQNMLYFDGYTLDYTALRVRSRGSLLFHIPYYHTRFFPDVRVLFNMRFIPDFVSNI